MIRPVRLLFVGLIAALGAPLAGHAQSAGGVQVEALRAPDIFSTAARDTGLGEDLWVGTSADIARAVMPMLSRKPLSPAAQALALRLVATGAPAPAGAERDPELAGARGEALIALGDASGAARVLNRQPGVASSPVLSRAAAEAALLTGDDDGACRIEQALTQGREAVYWLRLRAYCQLKAGDAETAQLTFNLAQASTKDAVYARLMGARLTAAVAPPGTVAPPTKPSFRNGLERALSSSLGAESPPLPVPVAPVAETPEAIGLLTAAGGDRTAFDVLFARAAAQPGKVAQADRGAVLVLIAFGATLSPDQRAPFAGFVVDRGSAAPARLAALSIAANAGLKGETALLALAIAADAGSAGPGFADRAAVVAALRKVGLVADARAFAAEGLAVAPGAPTPPAVSPRTP